MKRGAILLLMTVATLVLAGGVALAVTKQCSSGTTQANPCKGTAKTRTSTGSDILVGTSGPDYITALSGNDWINGSGGDDTTDGGVGNDNYSYRDGFGTDTLKDSSGTDTVNLSVVSGGAGETEISLIPEWETFGYNRVFKSSTEKVNFSSGTVVERAVGTSGDDHIRGGKESNTLQPGPNSVFNEDTLVDWGGCSAAQCLAQDGSSLPASNDTYKGFRSGINYIEDFGGNADTLDLSQIASYEAHFEFSGDMLVVYAGSIGNQIQIDHYTTPQFRIERIVFSDTAVTGVN